VPELASLPDGLAELHIAQSLRMAVLVGKDCALVPR